MPSCLPVKIIDAKFNVTTIFPDLTGWPGRTGPGRVDGRTGTLRWTRTSRGGPANAFLLTPKNHC